MTDKEKVAALLTELGVGFTSEQDTITCTSGDTKVDGYPCFFTCFEFHSDGAFQKMGAWE